MLRPNDNNNEDELKSLVIKNQSNHNMTQTVVSCFNSDFNVVKGGGRGAFVIILEFYTNYHSNYQIPLS